VKTLISQKFKNIIIHDQNYRFAKLLKKKFPSLKIEKNLNKILLDNKILNCFLITPPSKNFKPVSKFIS